MARHASRIRKKHWKNVCDYGIMRGLDLSKTVVDVAQLVESRIVIPVVVGSSPIVHPIQMRARRQCVRARPAGVG